MQKLKAFLFLFTLLAFEVPAAKAQVLYGSIIGTVTDPSGAVVPKAEVNAVNPQTGETRNTITDDGGRYTLAKCVAGYIRVQVTAPGFSKASGVECNRDNQHRHPLRCATPSGLTGPGYRRVRFCAAALQTDKGDTHAELSPRVRWRICPCRTTAISRVFTVLFPAQLLPLFTNSITDTPQRPLSTNVNGTNRNNNNTRVDGAADVFVWLPHATLYVPPEETIETVNITTGSFDAEQGMAGGSAVTITTKSGTNGFHGVAFAYWDDNHLAARNFFYYGNGTPFSLHNIDGGTLGGPIVKNKLFFFGSWEGTRERTNYSALSTVPTSVSLTFVGSSEGG